MGQLLVTFEHQKVYNKRLSWKALQDTHFLLILILFSPYDSSYYISQFITYLIAYKYQNIAWNCSSLLKYIKIIEFHLPICDCGTMVLCRSHRGEYSRPSSASRSPWLKNSSMHRDVHWWWRSQRFAGWETSQECNIRLRTLVLSKLKFSK